MYALVLEDILFWRICWVLSFWNLAFLDVKCGVSYDTGMLSVQLCKCAKSAKDIRLKH